MPNHSSAIRPTEVRNELAAPKVSSRVPKNVSASCPSLSNAALWKWLASELPRTTTSVMIPAARVTRPSVSVDVVATASCDVVMDSVMAGLLGDARGRISGESTARGE